MYYCKYCAKLTPCKVCTCQEPLENISEQVKPVQQPSQGKWMGPLQVPCARCKVKALWSQESLPMSADEATYFKIRCTNCGRRGPSLLRKEESIDGSRAQT